MTGTLAEKAVVGRRVTLTFHRDLNLPNPPAYPGIITSVSPDKTSVWVRLDGKRYNLPARADYRGLTYLDQVVDVPALPMGRFTPTPADLLGVWEGVPLSTVGEDGEDLILLTADRDKAVAAAKAYDAEVGVHPDSANYDRVRACWAVFEWEPEDAEFPWTVDWDAAEGDDQAVQIYYLPA
ncbi:hypothetical protein [Streptomyces sp. NPDC001658]